jgi:hypothetical protein
MHRQRIQQLVGDEHPLERLRQLGRGRSEPVGDIGERGALSRACFRAGLDKVQPQRVVECGVAPFRGAQNVGGQAPITRANFDEVNLKSEI